MGKQKTRSLNLLLVGDVMLGRHVNKVLTSEPAAYPWGDTLPLFQRADVRLCNLECVLSDRRTPGATTPKPFHFRSDAKNIAVLQAAQVDAVSLANNHTLDFGVDALDDMCHLLKQAGIRFAGAGPTFREASHPAIWEVHGKRLGLIACTDNEPGWAASGKHAGVWYVPAQIQDTRAHHLFEVVQRTKMKVTSLIVSLHWGPNWGDVPPANHHPFAHALIDHGADIVFGHSGHVVRGIELYREKPIIYCAGDFIDDYAVDPVERNDQSFLFLIEWHEATGSRLRLYPTMIDQYQARRAKSDEFEVMIAQMQRHCALLNTETRWNKHEGCLEVARSHKHAEARK